MCVSSRALTIKEKFPYLSPGGTEMFECQGLDYHNIVRRGSLTAAAVWQHHRHVQQYVQYATVLCHLSVLDQRRIRHASKAVELVSLKLSMIPERRER